METFITGGVIMIGTSLLHILMVLRIVARLKTHHPDAYADLCQASRQRGKSVWRTAERIVLRQGYRHLNDPVLTRLCRLNLPFFFVPFVGMFICIWGVFSMMDRNPAPGARGFEVVKQFELPL